MPTPRFQPAGPMSWRPLSVRGADTPAAAAYDTLHEGVPPWLAPNLADWVQTTLASTGRAAAVKHRLRLVLHNASPADYELAEQVRNPGPGGDERALDILDATLSVSDSWLDVEHLSLMLEDGGSAWAVRRTAAGWGLERRVDETVAAAADRVIAAGTPAGGHLGAAWHGLYGRAPDPSKAVSEAIKAVEAAARPVVSPTHARATLGTMVSAMAAKPSTWRVSLAGQGRDGRSGVEVVVDMIRLLWSSQHDRHGTDAPTVPLSVEEAEMAVHLAVTLTHWFGAGLVSRDEP